MYSDFLLNFYQITEDSGLEEGAQILERMAGNHSFFALDSGIKADDIWDRIKRLKKCIALIEDEKIQAAVNNMFYFSAGIMPDYDAVENRFEEVEKLENTINEFKNSGDELASRLIAIGPAGVDHDWESVEYKGRAHDYFDSHTIQDEKDLFALQLTLAKKLDMPFILHSRKGFKESSDVLKAIKWNKGIVHGYAYTQNEIDFFLDLGWYISFCGTITYGGKKNFNDIADVVAYVPKDRLLIESDAPYYAPIPLKCIANEPAYINYTYEYIASKRGISNIKLSEIVDKNFQKFFGL